MAKWAVAMSGGVDSSVAAALLAAEGHEVVGLTMNLWPDWLPEPDDAFKACCGVSAIADARAVARSLGIRHYVLNMREEFEQAVIGYFVDEYARGRTPNPCIACNQSIKFSLLLDKMTALGLDGIATGHYARVADDPGAGRRLLLRGRDPAKDQSYVLFSLTQDQLHHTLFPLGDLRKEEVRKKALQQGLRVHDKPESQEVCFIQESSYHSFLSERLKESIEHGPILDKDGKVLGKHKGIPFYTIGQRRGLCLAKGKPLYVIGIDRGKNAIIVGGENEVYSDTFKVDSVHWIIPHPMISSMNAQVKIRYNHPASEAILSPKREDEMEVRFKSPQKAIAPGQAAVFYDGETVMGGGWIKEVIN